MERIKFIQAALYGMALAVLASPALASAQAAPQTAGGGGWILLVIFGVLALGIALFTMSQRKKFPKKDV